jgi:phage major head subunit gpT-like protein
MEFTAANIDLIFRDVSTTFQSAFTKTPVIYPEIASVIPAASAEVTQAFIDRIPQMRKWIGPRMIQNVIARSRTIVMEPYEDTIGMDVNLVEDDQIGLFMGGSMPMFAEAGAKWADGLIAKYLTTYAASVNGYDGVPNFSASHPILGGIDGVAPVGAPATQSNLALNTALSWDAVSAGIAAMESWVGYDGAPMGTSPDVLMVPPQLRTRAEQIVMTQWRSGIESNVAAPQENTLKSRGIRVISNPWLSGMADAGGANGNWWLLDTKRAIKPFAFYQRKPPTMTALTSPTDPNVFMNRQLLWGLDARGNASETVWWLSYAGTSDSTYIFSA